MFLIIEQAKETVLDFFKKNCKSFVIELKNDLIFINIK